MAVLVGLTHGRGLPSGQLGPGFITHILPGLCWWSPMEWFLWPRRVKPDALLPVEQPWTICACWRAGAAVSPAEPLAAGVGRQPCLAWGVLAVMATGLPEQDFVGWSASSQANRCSSPRFPAGKVAVRLCLGENLGAPAPDQLGGKRGCTW